MQKAPFKTKRFSLLIKALLLAFLILSVYVGNIVFFPQNIPNEQYSLLINKNQNLSMIATILQEQKIIKSKRAFLILLRVLLNDKKVNAGMYILKHPISLWGLIRRITHGKPDQISITISEGWTFDQLKHYIDNLEDVKHLTIKQAESDIRNILKIPAPNLEGLFYADTYYIVPQQSDLEIYQHAYKIMQLKLESAYLARSTRASASSPYQLLILSSLIQKETSKPEDMYLVSTVFHNRLRIGMKLQDDPAVFYGLRGKEKVMRKDFQIDTLYNTYLHNGLPPTPICIPSLAALVAAAHPLEDKEVYYFVAIGNGKTKFSDNYKDHMGAVNKYLKHSAK